MSDSELTWFVNSFVTQLVRDSGRKNISSGFGTYVVLPDCLVAANAATLSYDRTKSRGEASPTAEKTSSAVVASFALSQAALESPFFLPSVKEPSSYMSSPEGLCLVMYSLTA